MKLFDFSNAVGHQLTLFDSKNTIYTPILNQDQGLKVSCMHIESQGVIGFHQATIDQLFLVAQGEGWVRGYEEQRTPIKPGTAALWTAGEWHESGSETGMMAIIVEGEALEMSKILAELGDSRD